MAKDTSLRSRAYHRYFEGYEEREQCREDGGVTIRRYYTGMYYLQNVSDRQLLHKRIMLISFYTLSWALFLFASTRPVPCNITWYVTIPSVGALVLLIVNAVYLFFNVTAPHAMQIRTYRDAHQRFPAVSLFAGLCMLTTGIAALGSLLQNSTAANLTFVCVAAYLLGGICNLLNYRLENKTEYITKESDYPNRVMGSRIRYESDF